MLKSVTSVSVHHVIEGYSVDVYLPEFSVAIEYQGAQHFTPKLRGEVTE
jgi:very-short-patch-repair endonuclease